MTALVVVVIVVVCLGGCACVTAYDRDLREKRQGTRR